MSTLKEQAAIDIDMFMETGLPWVDQAVFTPQVGDPVSLNVILETDQYEYPDNYETRTTAAQYRIECLIKDIGQIPVAKVGTRNGDYFTIDGVKYEVSHIENRNNDFISFSAKVKD